MRQRHRCYSVVYTCWVPLLISSHAPHSGARTRRARRQTGYMSMHVQMHVKMQVYLHLHIPQHAGRAHRRGHALPPLACEGSSRARTLHANASSVPRQSTVRRGRHGRHLGRVDVEGQAVAAGQRHQHQCHQRRCTRASHPRCARERCGLWPCASVQVAHDSLSNAGRYERV